MQTKLHTESDKHLRDSVMRELEWDPEMLSQDINANAKDGAVTLTRFVHTCAERVAAERPAKSVYGVRAIANDIEVKPMTRTDPEIARDIVEGMKLDIRIPDERVTVTVRDGFVTLEGTLDWNYQRGAAESCTRKVRGVRGITNSIQLKVTASPTEVKAKIEEALLRNAEVDARRITVSASDDTVTLTGNVRSWFEREGAERAAWSAPGVSRIVDHIGIAP